MAYVWQRWIAAELRAAGLKVVEVEGWKDRGRPASTGHFNPQGPVTNHHTGSTSSWSRIIPTLATLIKGRPDLPGPLAQVAVAYDGTVYVLAAGRANHAGRVGKGGVVGMPFGADGNALALGDEIDTNGTQVMPKVQVDAIAGVNAVFLKHYKRGTSYVHRHQDISGTGKWDLGSRSTAQLRADAAAFLKRLTAPRRMITSDLTAVLANVRSNPLMRPSQAQADYEVAFRGAVDTAAQAVYINEYHPSYATALATVAKKYGYTVKTQGGLAVAWRRNRWTLSGIAYSLITKGVAGITPSRGVLRVANTTPAGTRVVFDCTMFPRGWMNRRYADYAVTHPLGVKLAKAIAVIVKTQTGVLKSAALVGADVNIGGLMDWSPYGVKPAASVIGEGEALDKMMQLHLFVPEGWSAKLVAADMLAGKVNTDHGLLWAHFQITRPR